MYCVQYLLDIFFQFSVWNPNDRKSSVLHSDKSLLYLSVFKTKLNKLNNVKLGEHDATSRAKMVPAGVHLP